MWDTQKIILIAGATGYLGQNLIKVCKRSGYKVHALCRNADKLNNLKSEIDRIIVADVTKPPSMAGIFKDVDVVISALGITRQKDGLSYWDIDYQANKNVLKSAVAEGVNQFGYVHVLNANKMKGVELVKAKSAFVADLQAAFIHSTICCPSGFFSDLEAFYEMAEKGRVYMFGDGKCKMSPIDGQDAAEACLDAVISGAPWVDIGGPDDYSQVEIAELAFEVLGRDVKISHLPYRFTCLVVGLLKLCGFQKQLGGLEFFLAASEIDMSAGHFGKISLKQHFEAQLTAPIENHFLKMTKS